MTPPPSPPTREAGMSDGKTNRPVVPIKSHKVGHVAIRISLRCRGGFGGDASNIDGRTELTVAEARELAEKLITFADCAEATVFAKQAQEQRRKQWRDREIAAGRMKVFGL